MTTPDSDPHTNRPDYTDDDYDPGWEFEDQYRQLLPIEVDESELLDHRPSVNNSEKKYRTADELYEAHPELLGIRGSAKIKSADELLEKLHSYHSHNFENIEEPDEGEPAYSINNFFIPEVSSQQAADEEWRRSMGVDHDHHYIRDEINLRLDADRVWAEDRWFEQDFRGQIEKSFEYKHPFASILLPFCGMGILISIPAIWFLFWLMGG